MPEEAVTLPKRSPFKSPVTLPVRPLKIVPVQLISPPKTALPLILELPTTWNGTVGVVTPIPNIPSDVRVINGVFTPFNQ